MTISTRNCYFLQLALESLRIQFWKNLELITVCDHASLADEVNDFLKANNMRGTTYVCEIGWTRTLKFKKCVELATGRWLVCLDSDDLLPTGALNILDQCLKLCPDADYFTSDQAHVDTKNRHLQTIQADPRENTLAAIGHRFRQKHLWGFKRSELPLFTDSLTHNYPCEDYWFFASLAMRGQMPLCIPFILCCYRRHTMQMTQREKAKISDMTDSIKTYIDRKLRSVDPAFFIRQETLCLKRLDQQEMMANKVKNQPSR